MTVITWTRAAKCKDCKFLKAEYIGKRKHHVCNNEESTMHKKPITLKTLVCDKWELS